MQQRSFEWRKSGVIMYRFCRGESCESTSKFGIYSESEVEVEKMSLLEAHIRRSSDESDIDEEVDFNRPGVFLLKRSLKRCEKTFQMVRGALFMYAIFLSL